MQRNPHELHPTVDVRQPERRRILQLLLGLVVFVGSRVLTTLAAVLVFAVTAEATGVVSVGEILSAPGPAAPVGFLVGAAFSILGFVLVVRFVSRRRVTEFSRAGAVSEIGIGLLVGFGVVAATVGLLAAIGVYRVTEVQLGWGVLTGIMFGVGPAIVEEIFFRGFLLRILDGWVGSWGALAIVSVLFALVHSFSSPAGPVAAVYVFLSASLLLNMAWFLTRRLWLPIALHLAFNASQSALFGLNVSGSEAGDGLLRAELSGPEWLTGGVMGGEGSLVLIVIALAAGVVMAVAGVRRGAMLPRASRSAAS
ncbi:MULTISPECIES: CPBP family intramembrane glutamic endopeptidase [Microbacterium]|uniref:CPBP family intramembrane glutamic endopeptidase n=1 Tax=Microbacterium TaxID=33882 RepID=UPI0027870611|nr:MULTISPECIES: CPBP family intramembrane glutamic endopeptidase [Microbacterium]MDQ1082391.1 membrane protease YdiL (CAAX protease family) [Microbacterium sp. SORGH_AS_0344]MDQ1168838.1 membrane protease YdiL (CAAX protease family) [Microbacterium proteolyticum]